MNESNRIYSFPDTDTTLTTSCHVYQRDSSVPTVQLHSHGLHTGFLFAENNHLIVVMDGDTELTLTSPSGSHRSPIVHVMYLSEKEILSASRDGGVNIWSFGETSSDKGDKGDKGVDSVDVLGNFSENNEVLEWKNYLNGSRNHLTSLEVSCPKYESGVIVATTKDGYLSVWSRETLIPLLSAANGNAPCLDPKGLYSVELFESAGLLVVGGFGRIYVHEDSEANDFAHITTLGGHRGPVLAVASLSLPNTCSTTVKDIIISGGEDKALVVWDACMFSEHARKDCAHGSSITSITVLDTASCGLSSTPLLVSASRDGRVRLWSLPSLTLMHDIGAHQGVVLAVSATLSYSRFGNRPALLSTGSDQLLKVWRIYRVLNWERRKHFALFLAHGGFIKALPSYLSQALSFRVEDYGRVTTGKEASDIEVSAHLQKEGNGSCRAVTRVFHVESMCREIISFL